MIRQSSYLESISDFGARRTLGMQGSLWAYINTGNPYDKNYYKPDEFCPCECEHNKNKNECKKKGNLAKILTIGALALAGIGASVAFIRTRNINLRGISERIRSFNIGGVVERIRNSNIFRRTGDFFDNIFNRH